MLLSPKRPRGLCSRRWPVRPAAQSLCWPRRPAFVGPGKWASVRCSPFTRRWVGRSSDGGGFEPRTADRVHPAPFAPGHCGPARRRSSPSPVAPSTSRLPIPCHAAPARQRSVGYSGAPRRSVSRRCGYAKPGARIARRMPAPCLSRRSRRLRPRHRRSEPQPARGGALTIRPRSCGPRRTAPTSLMHESLSGTWASWRLPAGVWRDWCPPAPASSSAHSGLLSVTPALGDSSWTTPRRPPSPRAATRLSRRRPGAPNRPGSPRP